jgi:type VI secretion system secreted protein Hcp
MAVDMFLKLDGIDGESQDAKHKGEIEIESFSWGASNSGSAAHGAGGGAGKVSMQDFSFVTPVSKASPKLFLACASGQHIRSGVLTVRSSGERAREFLKVTITDVLVSSWQQSGSAGDVVPTDQVTMNFAKIHVAYTEQSATGTSGETTEAGWDVKANTKF